MIHMQLTDILMDSLPDPHPWEGEVKALTERLIDKGVTIQKWISVKDGLPEKNETVLLLCKNGAMFTGFKTLCWDDDTRFVIHTALSSTKRLNKGRVTHWMPLPEPPKMDLED